VTEPQRLDARRASAVDTRSVPDSDASTDESFSRSTGIVWSEEQKTSTVRDSDASTDESFSRSTGIVWSEEQKTSTVRDSVVSYMAPSFPASYL